MRQAASLAIDRQALIDTIYSGRAVWENIINAGLGKWHLDPQSKDIGDGGKYFKQDKQAAKQLISAAGHSDTEVRFVYPNNAYGDVYNATADAVRGMLADAGFKLNVVTVDYLKDWINNGQGLFNKGAPPNQPTIGFALQTPFTDPDDFLTGMFTKAGNRNHDLLDDVNTDPAFLDLIKKQAVELDPDKRLQLVLQAQQVHAGLMYLPPIVYTKVYLMGQPWVQNMWVADDYYWGAEQAAYISVNNK
jgi:ABC-type transport system substrate-binding protein